MPLLSSLKRQLRNRFGVEIRRVTPGAAKPAYEFNWLFEADEFFQDLNARGIALSQTQHLGSKRHQKSWNLVQALESTGDLEGQVVECGCFKGLSAFLLNHYLKAKKPDHRGKEFHIYDSFAGLSEPGAQDLVSDPMLVGETPKPGGKAGDFCASLEHVKRTLAEFPEIEYHPGWIPASFAGQPERRYRFVHVDVDLAEPTRAAVEHFYPQLAPDGLLVCDDYGALLWPGARHAIDDFCANHAIRPFILSTGQALLRKRSEARE